MKIGAYTAFAFASVCRTHLITVSYLNCCIALNFLSHHFTFK